MEIDLVGRLPNSNAYSCVLTAYDVFSSYLFAVPLRKPDTTSVVRALLQIVTQYACVTKHIITIKRNAFTSQLMTELMKASGIRLDHANFKHAQTIGMDELRYQKLKQILKINVRANTTQWDRYDSMEVMAFNTTYHQSIKCTKFFHARDPHNAPDLKFSNPLQTRCNKTHL